MGRRPKLTRDTRFAGIEQSAAMSEREEFESSLRKIYRHAPYEDFVDLTVTMPDFQDIRLVAANVDILGLDPAVVESRLHVEMGFVDKVKEHPLYAEIKGRIQASFVKACGAKTFDEIAHEAQGAIGRRMIDLAETGNAREAVTAMSELAARVSAKKSRNDEPEDKGKNGPESPNNLLAGFQAFFGMMAAMTGQQQINVTAGAVDASKLNVPAAPKALVEGEK